MHALLLSAVIALTPPGQARAESMLQLATADQPLSHSALVEAPVREVWRAWTTTEGITSWMVVRGDVTLKIGGKLRTSYSKDSTLDDESTIENTIISFDPERMLSIKCTRVPKGFPFKKAMDAAWTVIYLEPVSESRTKVAIRMLGYSSDPESIEMKKFFDRGNQITLDALVKHFQK